MRKALKIIGTTLAAILLIITVVGLYSYFMPIRSYTMQQVEVQVPHTPEYIARGEKLTMMLCANCHMNSDTRKLSGIKMLDLPPDLGVAYSRNITQDKEHGIGNWSDGELVYLLRTGIKKDGHYTPPYMVKLPNMADDDINAIIAFLRSDNPIVTPDPTPSVESKPSFLTKLLCYVAFKPLPFPTKPVSLPDTNNKVEMGKYLATNLGCNSCHSADFKTNDDLFPEKSKGYFGGGNQPLDKHGMVMLTPNLTPDKETGIGNWTKDEFVNAVKTGIVKNQPSLRYPMEPYVLLTDDEAGAIFEYLQTIPVIHNKVDRSGL